MRKYDVPNRCITWLEYLQLYASQSSAWKGSSAVNWGHISFKKFENYLNVEQNIWHEIHHEAVPFKITLPTKNEQLLRHILMEG